LLPWKNLTDVSQIADLVEGSKQRPVAVFKHSTRCSISSGVKVRLEREWDIAEDQLDAYFLDLLKYRDLSDSVAETFQIRHQSPQLIILKDGEVRKASSHLSISVKRIKKVLELS